MNRNTVSALWFTGIAILVAALYLLLSAPDGGGALDDLGPPGDAGAESATADDRAGDLEPAPARRTVQDPEQGAPRSPGYRSVLSGFRGRVLRGGGAAGAGLDVTILRADTEALLGEATGLALTGARSPGWVAGRTRTDAAGEFLITGAWPGSFYLLRIGGGTAPVLSRIVPRAPGPGEIVDLGDIQLADDAAITGRVVDEAGRPIAGARVRAAAIPAHLLKAWSVERFDLTTPLLFSDGDRRHVLEIPAWLRERLAEFAIATTSTDRDGAFELTGVPSGEVAVFVNAADRQPAIRPATAVRSGATTDLGRIAMAAGQRVVGRVLDDAGRPVAGVPVLVGQGTALVPVVFAAPAVTTAADGRFAVQGFRPGRVVAATRRGPGAAWVISDRLPVADELVLRLPSGRDLTVRVTGGSGRPVAAPRFELLAAAPDTPDVDLARFGFRAPLPIAERLQRLPDGRFRLADLQQGRYLLVVRADGYMTRAVPFTLENDSELAVALAVQQPFEVIVTDGGGEPVAEAMVYVQSQGGFPRVPRLPIACGRTDEDGRLRVTEAVADRVLVKVSHPAYGSAERSVELPVGFVAVELRAAGGLAGTLTEAGRLPRAGRWNLAIRRSPPAADRLLDVPRLAEPAADGSFRVDGLAPGDYEISVIPAVDATPIGLLLDPAAFGRRLRSRDNQRVVPVHAGRITRIDLDTDPSHVAGTGPAAAVSGTVHVNGRPGEGLEVRGWHQRWLSGPVGADGRFDLGAVAVGRVGVYVIDPRVKRAGGFEMLWWKQIEVRADRPVELAIDLQLGQIDGEVRHADGHGVAGCQVKLTGRGTDAAGKATHTRFYGITDRQGRFHFANLPAGTYSAQVWDRRNGRGRVTDLAVRGGSVVSGVRIALLRVVRLSGRVDLRMLGPVAPQWTWLRLYGRDAQGRYTSKERGAKVRADGRFEVEGIPPGHYEVSIGAMFPRQDGAATTWDTRMFIHDGILEVGEQGLTGVQLRPRPRPAKPKPRPAPPPASDKSGKGDGASPTGAGGTGGKRGAK